MTLESMVVEMDGAHILLHCRDYVPVIFFSTYKCNRCKRKIVGCSSAGDKQIRLVLKEFQHVWDVWDVIELDLLNRHEYNWSSKCWLKDHLIAIAFVRLI